MQTKHIILILIFVCFKFSTYGIVVYSNPEIPRESPNDTIVKSKSDTILDAAPIDGEVIKYKKRKRIFNNFPCGLKDPFLLLAFAKKLEEYTKFPESRYALVQLFLILMWLIFIIPLLIILITIYIFAIVSIIVFYLLLAAIFSLFLAGITLLLGLSLSFWLSFAIITLGIILGGLAYLAIIYYC